MAIPFLTNTSFSAAVTVASTLTVGGDALVEDNIYLTDGGTVRGKIQLNSSDRDDLDIKAVSLGSNMKFFTVDTERMRITSGGTVGIGTITPDSKLDVTGGNITVNTNGVTFMNFKYGAAGSETSRGTITTDGIDLKINTVADLLLLPAGNVGIGTTTPNEKLQVFGNIHAFAPSGIDAGLFASTAASSTTIAIRSNGVTHFNGGNVGIGTTTPQDLLNLHSASASGNIGMKITRAAQTHGFRVGVNDSHVFLWTTEAQDMAFATSNNQRMTISAGGNVGIGLTNPDQKLVVNGSIKSLGGGSFAAGVVFASNISLAANITILNKAQTTYIPFATRNISGSEVVMDLTNVSINGGAVGPYLPLAGGTMTGVTQFNDHTQHGDQVQARFGTGNDLIIEHNGTHSFITNNTGDLNLASATGKIYFSQNQNNGEIVFENDNGAGGMATYLTIDGLNEFTKFSKPAFFLDGVKAQFGNSYDLQIYHDGSHSYIQDTSGTGDLRIDTNLFRLRSANGGETMIRAFEDGAVILSHNNFDKLTTTNTGITVTGGWVTNGVSVATANVEHTNNTKSLFGNGNNLQIYHDGSNGFITNTGSGAGSLIVRATNFAVQSADGTDDFITTVQNAQVNLFYNGAKKFETTAGGTSITGTIDSTGTITVTGANGNVGINTDTGKLLLGASYDLQIYHDGNNSFIQDTGTGDLYIDAAANFFVRNQANGEVWIKGTDSGVSLRFQDSQKLITSNTGITVTGNIDGAANMFLQDFIYHSGDGNTFFGFNSNDQWKVTAGGNVGIQLQNTGVYLYFGGNEKLRTVSGGVAITGAATATTATTGTSSNATLTTKSYVDGLVTGVPVYKGTWDASGTAGGTPDLRLAANKVLGNYYIVSTAGSATPNGAGVEPDSWNVGDWCIFSDVTPGAGTDLWQKIDNTSVISGAGTGQSVTKWEGTSGAASETLTDGPITFSGSNSTFAGNIALTGGSLSISGDGSNAVTFTESSAGIMTIAAPDDIILDAAGDIALDAGGDDIRLRVNGTTYGSFNNASSNLNIFSSIQDKSIKFLGNDGGTTITALTLNMADGGDATFAGTINSGSITSTGIITAATTFKSDSGSMSFFVPNVGEAMRIEQNTGRVGIGLTNPSATLELKGATGNAGYTLKTTDTSSNETFFILDGGRAGVRYSPFSVGIPSTTAVATNAIFQVEEAGLLTVLDGGNVGIGTIAPIQKLDTPNIIIGGPTIAGVYRANATLMDNLSGVARFYALGPNTSTAGGYQFNCLSSNATAGPGTVMTILNSGDVGIGTTGPIYKLSVSGGIEAGGKVTYTKSAGSLNTTGYAVAGIVALPSGNGFSCGFTFTCFGGAGKYQRLVYGCYNSGGTWNTKKVIDEGTNDLDVVASANGSTITFTFKARSSNQSFTPRVTVEAAGTAINSTYA